MIPGIELSPRCGYVNVIGGFQGLTPLAIHLRRVAAKAIVIGCLQGFTPLAIDCRRVAAKTWVFAGRLWIPSARDWWWSNPGLEARSWHTESLRRVWRRGL